MGEFVLERAVERWGRPLFAYAYSLLGDYHEAEDAVQDAFIAAYQSRERFDGANERAWLYRITCSKCMDILRRRTRLSLEELNEDIAAAPPAGEYTSDIMTALSRLDPADRALVLMRIVEGLDYSEIAGRLGAGEAALRKRYERAKKRLAAFLTEGESEA